MAVAFAQEALRIRDTGHLSDAQIGRAVGAAPSTVRDWFALRSSPTGTRAERIAELAEIVDRLTRVIDQTEPRAWRSTLTRSMPLGPGCGTCHMAPIREYDLSHPTTTAGSEARWSTRSISLRTRRRFGQSGTATCPSAVSRRSDSCRAMFGALAFRRFVLPISATENALGALG